MPVGVRPCGRLLAAILFLAFSGGVRGAVILEWRPAAQTARTGDIVRLDLFAKSSSATPQPFRALSAIVTWDPTRLDLLGLDDAQNGYPWLMSFFPNDAGLDRFNDDCGDGVFCSAYTGKPFNDGDAYYEALARFAPAPLPEATPGGLRITSFRFRVLRPGPAQVAFAPVGDGVARTRVVGAAAPGTDITGSLGPPAAIDVIVMTAADIPQFLSCMKGPGVSVSQTCRRFDADGDTDVDARDAAAFQDAYVRP